jgi:hypothetical protein
MECACYWVEDPDNLCVPELVLCEACQRLWEERRAIAETN